MMDAELAALVAQETPDLNMDIARGLAVKSMRNVEHYIDAHLRAVFKGIPAGLQYIKLEPCDPQLEYNELTKPRGAGRRYYDVARSDLNMSMLTFKFGDREIKRFLSLPFVGPAGELYLGGSRFVIAPVLADPVMSIDDTSIFIRFGKGKVTFSRVLGNFRANGLNQDEYVVHGNLYNRTPAPGEAKPENKGAKSLIHYLFCKYGVSETFRLFTGHVPTFGYDDIINESNYPNESWVICQSTGIEPETVPNRKIWKPDPIRLVVPREAYTPMMRSFIAGFFYIVDHFPGRLSPKYLDHTGIWRILLGELLFGSNEHHGILQEKITDHLGSLDVYVDEQQRKKFRSINHPVDDIYQFFGVLIENFTQWLLEGADRINSLYGKELNVLSYVMEEVTNMINTFYFKLTAFAKSKKANARELKYEDIVGLMDKILKPGKFYMVRRGHAEVTTTSCSGDNMAFKITSMMVPQDKASRNANHSDSGAMTDKAKRLHFSTAEIGGYANMPKSDPSGHSRINLFAMMDPVTSVMVPNPKLAELRERTGAMLRRLT